MKLSNMANALRRPLRYSPHRSQFAGHCDHYLVKVPFGCHQAVPFCERPEICKDIEDPIICHICFVPKG